MIKCPDIVGKHTFNEWYEINVIAIGLLLIVWHVIPNVDMFFQITVAKQTTARRSTSTRAWASLTVAPTTLRNKVGFRYRTNSVNCLSPIAQ